ncbi:MAG: lysostaphin resistance A-like protein [Phycisphaerales bacterium]
MSPPADQISSEQSLSVPVLAGVVALAIGVVVWLWRRGVLKSGGLEVGGLRTVGEPWRRWSWVALAAMGVGVFLLSQFGAATALAFFPIDEIQARSLRSQGLANTCGLLAGIAGAGAALVMLGHGNRAEDVRIWPRHYAVGAVCFLLAAPVLVVVGAAAMMVYVLVTGHRVPEVGHELLRVMMERRSEPWAMALLIGAVVGAPIVEEVVFRVLLQTAMQKALGSAWSGILVTSVVFTAIHWGAVPPESFAVAAASLFALSVCMGVAYERTRMAGVPIVMHAMFNLANVGMALAQ